MTWSGLTFTKIYLTKLNGVIHFSMATKRHMLITFKDKSFVDRLEILLCLLAVGANLPLSYSMAINCLKKYFSNLAL